MFLTGSSYAPTCSPTVSTHVEAITPPHKITIEPPSIAQILKPRKLSQQTVRAPIRIPCFPAVEILNDPTFFSGRRWECGESRGEPVQLRRSIPPKEF